MLELDAEEFEILVGHLLTALGFEDAKVVGRCGDGGVDVVGELNVANLARMRVFVKVKRYKLGTRISAGTVRDFRKAIPSGEQGAFVTTADFQDAAEAVVVEARFPRIGLVRGASLSICWWSIGTTSQPSFRSGGCAIGWAGFGRVEWLG